MNVLIFPNINGSYLKSVEECASCNDKNVVRSAKTRDFILHKDLRTWTDIAIVNFLEDINATGIGKFKHFFAALLLILLLKINRIKIITTVHSILPHEHSWDKGALIVRKALLSQADAVISLCNETNWVLKQQLSTPSFDRISKKIVKIPAPDYSIYYPYHEHDYRTELDIPKEAFIVVFLGGTLRPYKHVERVFSLAKRLGSCHPDIIFIISGTESPKEMKKHEETSRTLANTRFVPKHIDDKDLAAFILTANISIMPLDTRDALNSSSYLLSYSLGRHVIGPSIGTAKEIPEELQFPAFDNQLYGEDPIAALETATLKAYRFFREKPIEYAQRQMQLQEYCHKENSPDKLKYLYCKLLNYLQPESR